MDALGFLMIGVGMFLAYAAWKGVHPLGVFHSTIGAAAAPTAAAADTAPAAAAPPAPAGGA